MEWPGILSSKHSTFAALQSFTKRSTMEQASKLFFKRINVSCGKLQHAANPENKQNQIADKQIQAIAMDWITGNLYGVNHAGVVFACNTEGGNPLKCATVLRDQGRLHGIAVDPAQGYVPIHSLFLVYC